MNLFRSSLFGMLVALFVATGHGWNLSGQCCLDEETVCAQQTEVAHSDQTAGQDDGCQCVCHQSIFHGEMEIAEVTGLAVWTEGSQVVADEVPPDAVPHGIEYPPQLG